MAFNDVVCDGKSQSKALSNFLGCEKRVPDPVDGVLGDAASGISITLEWRASMQWLYLTSNARAQHKTRFYVFIIFTSDRPFIFLSCYRLTIPDQPRDLGLISTV
jgi:hypothetical protein